MAAECAYVAIQRHGTACARSCGTVYVILQMFSNIDFMAWHRQDGLTKSIDQLDRRIDSWTGGENAQVPMLVSN